MRALPITGEYPADWDQIGDDVRAKIGHRCVRCGHPFEVGKHGKGEWSPCDEKCTHKGPLAIQWPDGSIAPMADFEDAYTAYRFFGGGVQRLVAQWRILTVHHLDGNKSNCDWWNLLALCQRCHLTIQGKVNPMVPYFLGHTDWFKPYVAGFYAKTYLKLDLTRAEVEARLPELLALEQIA